MRIIEEIMTKNPICCIPETSLREVAQLMLEYDCGEIPVLNNEEEKIPLGVITDRDICCRSLALGKNPIQMTVNDCMSSPAVVGSVDMTLEECSQLMKLNQIRRLPIIGTDERVCGIVAQADLVRHLDPVKSAGFVREISEDSLPQ